MDRGLDGNEALSDLRELDLEVFVHSIGPRPRRLGCSASATREAGLSLSDRACLALAQQRGAPTLTTDRRQADVASAIGVTVELIR